MNLLASSVLWLLAAAQLAILASGKHVPTTRFSGTIKVFEYGVFKSDDGEFYSFKLVSPDAREPYFRLFRSHPRTEILCLRVEFDGHRSGLFDFNRAEFVNIVRFQRIEKAKCA